MNRSDRGSKLARSVAIGLAIAAGIGTAGCPAGRGPTRAPTAEVAPAHAAEAAIPGQAAKTAPPAAPDHAADAAIPRQPVDAANPRKATAPDQAADTAIPGQATAPDQAADTANPRHAAAPDQAADAANPPPAAPDQAADAANPPPAAPHQATVAAKTRQPAAPVTAPPTATLPAADTANPRAAGPADASGDEVFEAVPYAMCGELAQIPGSAPSLANRRIALANRVNAALSEGPEGVVRARALLTAAEAEDPELAPEARRAAQALPSSMRCTAP